MWLLSTDRAELTEFDSPEEVLEGFAIFSHTWNKSEETFDDIQKIHDLCRERKFNPRDFVGDKIRNCCELAERNGYKWVWIDTCCIDKSSSAELSEAINSMYRYYSLSRVCYAYIQDWHSTTPLFKCRWFERGWTLQELIAPESVILLDSSWKTRGFKGDFAKEIHQATRVPASLLRLEKSLTDFSIAQRMSWAARRKTCRVEDEAYCLLGIFNINMPTLYGEGRKAFRRLQEEIMRHNPDTTLFAWGDVRSSLEDALRHVHVDQRPFESSKNTSNHLFADRPGCFESSNDIECARQSTLESLRFTMTPSGIHVRVRTLQISGITFADFGFRGPSGPLFLALTPGALDDSSRSIFHVGVKDPLLNPPPRSQGYWLHLMVPLEADPHASWEYRDISFTHHLPPVSEYYVGDLRRGLAFAHSFHSPFRFSVSQAIDGGIDPRGHSFRLTSVMEPFVSWDTSPPSSSDQAHTMQTPALLRYQDHSGHRAIVVQLGICTQASAQNTVWDHWARVDLVHEFELRRSQPTAEAHKCHEDHISVWKALRKSFVLGNDFCVILSFRSNNEDGYYSTLWMEALEFEFSLTSHRKSEDAKRARADTLTSSPGIQSLYDVLPAMKLLSPMPGHATPSLLRAPPLVQHASERMNYLNNISDSAPDGSSLDHASYADVPNRDYQLGDEGADNSLYTTQPWPAYITNFQSGNSDIAAVAGTPAYNEGSNLTRPKDRFPAATAIGAQLSFVPPASNHFPPAYFNLGDCSLPEQSCDDNGTTSRTVQGTDEAVMSDEHPTYPETAPTPMLHASSSPPTASEDVPLTPWDSPIRGTDSKAAPWSGNQSQTDAQRVTRKRKRSLTDDRDAAGPHMTMSRVPAKGSG